MCNGAVRMTPEQISHALEPLRVVDVKSLDEMAATMRKSKNAQKRAVGAFLARINRYRVENTSKPNTRSLGIDVKTGLTDLTD